MTVSEETIQRSKLSVYNNLCLAHDISKILATILPLREAVAYEVIRDEMKTLIAILDSTNDQHH